MWFNLISTLNKPDTLIEIQGSYNKITDFFWGKEDSLRYLNETGFIKAVAQSGFTEKDLNNCDYLDCVSMSIPLFSERFFEKMEVYLKEQMDFYPCKIHLGDKVFSFYLGKIKNVGHAIDETASGHRKLTDGSKILSEPIIIKNNLDENFLIVRDVDYLTQFFVSSKFKELVINNGMNIGFYDMSKSFW